MWIIAADRSLWNTDQMVRIKYDEDSDSTMGWLAPAFKWVKLCEGDVTPVIVSAMSKNQNYVRVN